jgi:hypothetical protein
VIKINESIGGKWWMGSSAGRFEINLIDIYKEQFYWFNLASSLLRLCTIEGGLETIKQSLIEVADESKLIPG